MDTPTNPKPWHIEARIFAPGGKLAASASRDVDGASVGLRTPDAVARAAVALVGIPDPTTELTRLRAIEGAAREHARVAGEGRLTIAFTVSLDNLNAALSGNAPPDPRDEEIRRLRAGLTDAITELRAAGDWLRSNGRIGGAKSVDRAVENARAALTHRSDK